MASDYSEDADGKEDRTDRKGDVTEEQSGNDLLTRRSMLQTTGAALAAAAGLGISSTGNGAAQSSSSDIDVAIGFDDSTYLDQFSQSYRTDYNTILDSSSADGGASLGVQFGSGDHWGASMRYRFSDEGYDEPETLYYRYQVYFPTDFEVVENGGKLPGPAGTYDTAGWGGRESDGTNGWSARMSFTPGSDSDHVQVGWYCYHADMGSWGSNWAWSNNGAGDLAKGEWHEITGEVAMNTPGENDGVLRGWVNGDPAFEKTDVRFRDTTDLKIQDFWFNAYYGGSWASPSDNEIRFDDLRLMTDFSVDTSTDDSTSDSLPKSLVVDGESADDVTTYTFTVTGDITRDIEASTSTENDQTWCAIEDVADGGKVVGLVADNVDVFRYSGEVTDFTVDGDAAIYMERND